MRNISFALTIKQVREKTKTVTRRMGWENLKPGQLLCAVVKGQGLKPGEKIERICVINVVAVSREMLGEIAELDGEEECRLEGFPDLSPEEFIEMFCKSHKGCTPSTWVTRIEFEYPTLSDWCDYVDKGGRIIGPDDPRTDSAEVIAGTRKTAYEHRALLKKLVK